MGASKCRPFRRECYVTFLVYPVPVVGKACALSWRSALTFAVLPLHLTLKCRQPFRCPSFWHDNLLIALGDIEQIMTRTQRPSGVMLVPASRMRARLRGFVSSWTSEALYSASDMFALSWDGGRTFSSHLFSFGVLSRRDLSCRARRRFSVQCLSLRCKTSGSHLHCHIFAWHVHMLRGSIPPT